MFNPIDAGKKAVGSWLENKSPTELGGLAMGALSLIGVGLVAYAGRTTMSDVIDVMQEENNFQRDEKKDDKQQQQYVEVEVEVEEVKE